MVYSGFAMLCASTAEVMNIDGFGNDKVSLIDFFFLKFIDYFFVVPEWKRVFIHQVQLFSNLKLLNSFKFSWVVLRTMNLKLNVCYVLPL